MATKRTTARQARKTGKAAKPATKRRPAKRATPAAQSASKLSQFQAAIQVLSEAGEPMNCRAMVEAMTARGLWSSPAGKTPEATLYASILRNIRKGKDATFAKADRGLFTLAGRPTFGRCDSHEAPRRGLFSRLDGCPRRPGRPLRANPRDHRPAPQAATG